jgi:hypothetical protein
MNWWRRKQASASDRELPIPEAAVRDETALEVLRAWESDGGLQCSLLVGLALRDRRDYAAAWGYALADIAYEIAMAVKSSRGTPVRLTIGRIQQALEAEIREDRPDVRGDFVD